MLNMKLSVIIKTVLFFVLVFSLPINSFASDCFSTAPTIEAGRDPYEEIVARELEEGEREGLKELLNALDGKWEGTGEELVCLGTTEEPEEKVDEFSIEATVKMSRGGQFAFKSTLVSREKREKRHETIRLHLGKKHLATAEGLSVSDIELVSLSNEELVYIQKSKSHSGTQVREMVIAIQKSGDDSFMFEKHNYMQGLLKSVSSWNLERK
jgi:hypothetical protein